MEKRGRSAASARSAGKRAEPVVEMVAVGSSAGALRALRAALGHEGDGATGEDARAVHDEVAGYLTAHVFVTRCASLGLESQPLTFQATGEVCRSRQENPQYWRVSHDCPEVLELLDGDGDLDCRLRFDPEYNAFVLIERD